MLISDLCDYSDADIVVKGRITVEGYNDDKTRNKKLIFKNNAPFRSCITKINNTFINNGEDPDIVMPMYNLLQYSDSYSMTSGSLWNYYRDKVNDSANEIDDNDNKVNNNKTTSKSFEYETKIIGSTPNNNNILDAVVVVLKHLSNFWRYLDLPLINCEIKLDLSWSKEFIIYEISITPRTPANSDVNPPVQKVAAVQTIRTAFQINNPKLYFPVVTLSMNDNIKFLENIKQGFKITISWNK